jgi:hypothetical protein
LIEICSKIDKLSGNVSITKEQSNGSRVLLESLEDITDHIAIVRVPFKIIGKEISVDFSNLGVEIEYSKTEEVAAQSIFASLQLHSPAILNYFFRSAFVFAAIALFIPIVLGYVGDPVPIERFPNTNWSDFIRYGFTLCAIIVLFISFPTFGLLVRVYHRHSDSFFQRNKDRIIFSASSFILGIFATYLVFPWLESFLKGP